MDHDKPFLANLSFGTGLFTCAKLANSVRVLFLTIINNPVEAVAVGP
jgi:hypothetical protein